MALDAETSALDAETSAPDAETSALGAARSEISRSCRQVGITPQMCNRVTNHVDMSTFSKPGSPLEFVFQEQSYSILHSGQSLTWDHVHGDIDDPCSGIADFCGVIADPCGVVAIHEAIGSGRCGTPARLSKHHKTLLNTVKHHETHVEHRDTS